MDISAFMFTLLLGVSRLFVNAQFCDKGVSKTHFKESVNITFVPAARSCEFVQSILWVRKIFRHCIEMLILILKHKRMKSV